MWPQTRICCELGKRSWDIERETFFYIIHIICKDLPRKEKYKIRYHMVQYFKTKRYLSQEIKIYFQYYNKCMERRKKWHSTGRRPSTSTISFVLSVIKAPKRITELLGLDLEVLQSCQRRRDDDWSMYFSEFGKLWNCIKLRLQNFGRCLSSNLRKLAFQKEMPT